MILTLKEHMGWDAEQTIVSQLKSTIVTVF